MACAWSTGWYPWLGAVPPRYSSNTPSFLKKRDEGEDDASEYCVERKPQDFLSSDTEVAELIFNALAKANSRGRHLDIIGIG